MADWAQIHEDRKFRVSRLPLALLSLTYGAAVKIRLKLINNEKAKPLPGFTISVGNLTAGGTGKTPAVQMIAKWAAGEGYSVAILSRGYGGQKRQKVTIVSDGVSLLADQKVTGDEAYLMAKALKGIPVVVSKDRYLAGLEAHERFGSSFFILDDGFQHIKLKRNLNILLLDAASPFGNGHLLPLGPLREPVSELRRADAVILTRVGALINNPDKKDELKDILAGRLLFTADHLPEKIVCPSANEIYTPDFLKGKRVAAFAGIARPHLFRDTLIGLGAEIVDYRAFPDHHPFSSDEIKDLISRKKDTRADVLVTTEKDWVRVESLLPEGHAMAYLTVRFDLIDGKEQFFNLIKEKERQHGAE